MVQTSITAGLKDFHQIFVLIVSRGLFKSKDGSFWPTQQINWLFSASFSLQHSKKHTKKLSLSPCKLLTSLHCIVEVYLSDRVRWELLVIWKWKRNDNKLHFPQRYCTASSSRWTLRHTFFIQLLPLKHVTSILSKPLSRPKMAV